MTRIFHWFFMWKMDPMSGCNIRLVFTLQPRDSTLQYLKFVHLWNNFIVLWLRIWLHAVHDILHEIQYMIYLMKNSTWYTWWNTVHDILDEIQYTIYFMKYSTRYTLWNTVHDILDEIHYTIYFMKYSSQHSYARQEKIPF